MPSFEIQFIRRANLHTLMVEVIATAALPRNTSGPAVTAAEEK